MQRLTKLEGVEQAELDRSGKQLLLTYSTPYMRTQISVAKADGSGAPRPLTDTRTRRIQVHDLDPARNREGSVHAFWRRDLRKTVS